MEIVESPRFELHPWAVGGVFRWNAEKADAAFEGLSGCFGHDGKCANDVEKTLDGLLYVRDGVRAVV